MYDSSVVLAKGVGFPAPSLLRMVVMKKRLFSFLIFISSVSAFLYVVKSNASVGDKVAAEVAIFLAVACVCLGRRCDD